MSSQYDVSSDVSAATHRIWFYSCWETHVLSVITPRTSYCEPGLTVTTTVNHMYMRIVYNKHLKSNISGSNQRDVSMYISHTEIVAVHTFVVFNFPETLHVIHIYMHMQCSMSFHNNQPQCIEGNAICMTHSLCPLYGVDILDLMTLCL